MEHFPRRARVRLSLSSLSFSLHREVIFHQAEWESLPSQLEDEDSSDDSSSDAFSSAESTASSAASSDSTTSLSVDVGGCKVEMPWLVDLYRRHRAEGLEIIGVSMDDAGEDVIARFAKSKNVNYTIAKGNESVASAYGHVQMMPQTFLIGRDGTITGQITGVPNRRELDETIQQLLKSR